MRNMKTLVMLVVVLGWFPLVGIMPIQPETTVYWEDIQIEQETLQPVEVVESVTTIPEEEIIEPEPLFYYDLGTETEVQQIVRHYLEYFSIELDETYVYAMIFHESRFNPQATGSSGDCGYLQILRRYFQSIYNQMTLDYPELVSLPTDVFDKQTNIACGLYWLNQCAIQMSGEPLNSTNLTRALTAYNRGVNGAKIYYSNNATYVSDYSQNIIQLASIIQQNDGLTAELKLQVH